LMYYLTTSKDKRYQTFKFKHTIRAKHFLEDFCKMFIYNPVTYGENESVWGCIGPINRTRLEMCIYSTLLYYSDKPTADAQLSSLKWSIEKGFMTILKNKDDGPGVASSIIGEKTFNLVFDVNAINITDNGYMGDNQFFQIIYVPKDPFINYSAEMIFRDGYGKDPKYKKSPDGLTVPLSSMIYNKHPLTTGLKEILDLFHDIEKICKSCKCIDNRAKKYGDNLMRCNLIVKRLYTYIKDVLRKPWAKQSSKDFKIIDFPSMYSREMIWLTVNNAITVRTGQLQRVNLGYTHITKDVLNVNPVDKTIIFNKEKANTYSLLQFQHLADALTPTTASGSIKPFNVFSAIKTAATPNSSGWAKVSIKLPIKNPGNQDPFVRISVNKKHITLSISGGYYCTSSTNLFSRILPGKGGTRTEPVKIIRMIYIGDTPFLLTETGMYISLKEYMSGRYEYPNSSSSAHGKTMPIAKFRELAQHEFILCLDYAGFDRHSNTIFIALFILLFVRKSELMEDVKMAIERAFERMAASVDDLELQKKIRRLTANTISPLGITFPLAIPMCEDFRLKDGSYDEILPFILDKVQVNGPFEFSPKVDDSRPWDVIDMKINMIVNYFYTISYAQNFIHGKPNKARGLTGNCGSMMSGALMTSPGNNATNTAIVKTCNQFTMRFREVPKLVIDNYNAGKYDNKNISINIKDMSIAALVHEYHRKYIPDEALLLSLLIGLESFNPTVRKNLPTLPFHNNLSFTVKFEDSMIASDDHICTTRINSTNVKLTDRQLVVIFMDMLIFATAMQGYLMKPKDLKLSRRHGVFLNSYIEQADYRYKPKGYSATGSTISRRHMAMYVHEDEPPQDWTSLTHGSKALVFGGGLENILMNMTVVSHMSNRTRRGTKEVFDNTTRKVHDRLSLPDRCDPTIPGVFPLGFTLHACPLPKLIRLARTSFRNMTFGFTKNDDPLYNPDYDTAKATVLDGEYHSSTLLNLLKDDDQKVLKSGVDVYNGKEICYDLAKATKRSFSNFRGVIETIPAYLKKTSQGKSLARQTQQYYSSDKTIIEKLSDYKNIQTCSISFEYDTSSMCSYVRFQTSAKSIRRPISIPMIQGVADAILVTELVFGISMTSSFDLSRETSLKFADDVLTAPRLNVLHKLIRTQDDQGKHLPKSPTAPQLNGTELLEYTGLLCKDDPISMINKAYEKESLLSTTYYSGTRLADLSLNIIATSNLLFGKAELNEQSWTLMIIDSFFEELSLRCIYECDNPELLSRPFLANYC